jgi:iron complex transport system substrate-binding protein
VTASTANAAVVPRIVSTVPAATLNLVRIGGADKLVGVTKYDQLYLPKEQQDLPVVGDYETMNLERLVSLKPTAVIVQTAELRMSAQLKAVAVANHIEIVNVKLDTVADLWTTVKALGKVSGREKAAEKAIAEAQAELKKIAEENKGKPRVKVVYIIGRNPYFVAGGGTFLDEMITLAGGENVAAKVGEIYPVIGNELMAKLAPEVVLVSAVDEQEQQRDDPRLAALKQLPIPAAKSGRIYLVTDGYSLMASVEIGKQVRMLTEMMHRGMSEAGAGSGVGATTTKGVGN